VTGDSFYREYNELNQLSVVREGNLSTGEILEKFTWHPTEERILIKDVYENGVFNYSVYYVSDEFVRIENSSGNFTEKYIKQNGFLVAQVNTNGGKEVVLPDHLGSSDTILDSDGNVLSSNFFSPFGEQIEFGNSRYGYEGKEFDEKTQDTDFHFRKYRPDWGRFTQPDTLIQNVYDPQMLNRYAFERNNPMGQIDPDGHKTFGNPESAKPAGLAVAKDIEIGKKYMRLSMKAAKNGEIGLAAEYVGKALSNGFKAIIDFASIGGTGAIVTEKDTGVYVDGDLAKPVTEATIGYDEKDYQEDEKELEEKLAEKDVADIDPQQTTPDGQQPTSQNGKNNEPGGNGGGDSGSGGSSGGNPGYWATCTQECTTVQVNGKPVTTCKWVCTT